MGKMLTPLVTRRGSASPSSDKRGTPNSDRRNTPGSSRRTTTSPLNERRGSNGSFGTVNEKAYVQAIPCAVWGGKNTFSSCVDEGKRRYYDVIIVGGGNASGYCASELVKLGISNGKVLIISGESIPPYERAEYCWKLLNTGEAPKDLFTCTQDRGGMNQNAIWYAANGVDLLLETYVTQFHGGDRTVMCSNGMLYTACRAIIIATGSMPKQLPIAPNSFGGDIPFDCKLEGVHYFSNQFETLGLAATVHSRKPDHVVVVGAGFLGIQLTSFLISKGIRVTVICKHAHIVPYLFPEEVAQLVEANMEKHGVTFVRKTKALDVRGKDGCLTSVRLSDGSEVQTSHAIVCIGHRARSAVFRELQMKDEFISVDHYFRTNCPGVYAIGDVCAFPLVDTHSRMHQHALDARRSGVHCAKTVKKDISANPSAGLISPASNSVETPKSLDVEKMTEMFMAADLEDAFEPSPNLVYLQGPCALNFTFMGETIGDEVITMINPEREGCIMSVWIRDWRVLGVLVGCVNVTRNKVLQLAVKNQVLVDVRKLRECTNMRDGVEVICEKMYLKSTPNPNGEKNKVIQALA